MFTAIVKSVLSRASGRGPKSRLLICTYHRTMEHPDPYINDLTGEVFDVHARTLSRYCSVLRLDEATAMLAQGTLPPRAAVITFDDGYADNFSVALPILRRHEIKATFFVASGYLDGGTMWNDIVIHALRTASDEALDAYRQQCGKDGALAGTSLRRELIRDKIKEIKYLAPSARDRAARDLAAQLDAGLPEGLMMTSDEVRQLAAAGMEVGAHTDTHPILSKIPLAEAEQEIVTSRDALQRITGEDVTSFAYPNGVPGRDFDGSHVELLRKLDFSTAVTTAQGVADASHDPLTLPRIGLWQRHPVKLLAGLLRHYRRPGTT